MWCPLIAARFEVNTDVSLIDPDWDDFAEYHDQRYGLAIAYIKGVVQGQSHANKVMDFIVGDEGFYTQAKSFPAAFYGDMGQADIDVISEADAQAIVWEATALYRAGEAQSLSCFYSDASPAEVFFGYRVNNAVGSSERYELGGVRNSLPMHLRIMIDSDEASDILGHRKGVLIYQRSSAGNHLVLRAPGRRQPFPLLDGFSD